MMKAKSKDRIVKVGCCGFGLSRAKYAAKFSTVEVQQTFYQPPKVSTLNKWRAEVPSNFDFAIKAWQIITHSCSSPTYRRLRTDFSQNSLAAAGNFNSSTIVKEAWDVTLACADALNATHILFQCPASFKPTETNISNMRKFFHSVEYPENRLLCWEPRGTAWTADIVLDLCTELNLVHVVDPFVARTVTTENFYFRMHGRTGWRHEFTDDELDALSALLPERSSGCVYFNNVSMVEDASNFDKKLLRG